MNAVGVFLGVEPTAGGMFQYAQSVLEALRVHHNRGGRVEVAHVAPLWQPVLERYPFHRVRISGGKLGLRMADMTMAARLPGSASRMLARHFNPIPRQLHELACDLWIFPAQDSLSYQVDLPVVASVHDLMHRYEPQFPEVSQGGRFAIREHRFRNLVSWSRAVLVDSEIGRQHVVESYGANPAKVHPLHYVAPRYIAEAEPSDFDARYPLPKKFLFYPAQFWAHKNHLRLLNAAASVREHCPDIHLVFSGGKGHGHAEVRAHAESLSLGERVIFPGFVPDLYLSGFYRRARALVMPTFFGPTNIPPLEAFSCGCPAAVSNIYGMPEQARGAALLFDPRSTEEIADVILRLWHDDELCSRLATAGSVNAQQWTQNEFASTLNRILLAASTQPNPSESKR